MDNYPGHNPLRSDDMEKEKPSDIRGQFDRLAEQISLLESVQEGLLDRLSPVVLPGIAVSEVQFKTSGVEISEDTLGSSPIANDLWRLANKLDGIIGTFVNLKGRIDL